MGRRGPQAEPTAIKEAKGNPGRRRLNENEPVPPSAPVTPPRWLPPTAIEIWNDLAPYLITMRVLTVVDRFPFARYCRMMARYIELQEAMWDKGPQGTLYPLKDKKGKVRNAAEWPMAAELRRLQEMLVRLEDRFGMTPWSRCRRC
jgi:P27 family predicted phage terminase small subunit